MFEKLIGNNKVKDFLQASINSNKTSHSYIFYGPEGIGKKEFAKEFAKTLLCQEAKNNYCDKCKACIEFDTSNNPDFSIIEPEGNVIKINQIRELQKKIQERPIISNKKVYIINNADLMNEEAQNCLLKTLEEPPSYITIILVGANNNAFLNTIKSRCMSIKFNSLSDNELKTFLSNNFADENFTDEMIKRFQGSISKAILLKDKKELYDKIDSIIENIEKLGLIDFINQAEIIYRSKEEIQDILNYINTVIITKAKTKVEYAKVIEIVEETKKRLKQNCNYDMSIDDMLWKIWEEVN